MQPDGTHIVATLHGDEHCHWAETPQGFTLLPSDNGFWEYACKNERGQIVPSGLSASVKQVPAWATRLRPTRLTGERKAPGVSSDLQIASSFPCFGKRKLLVLLINYSDTQPQYSQADFMAMMNESGYKGIGSFRDYYLAQSYGALDIETTVTPWVTLVGDKAHYGADGAVNMIVEALKIIDPDINLKDFDNDGDGVLDGLAVIHQGCGYEMSGNPADIWSHSSEIYGLELDGVTVRRYTIEPEQLSTGQQANIGVISHEFGHNLGAPDFYDSDYEGSGGEFPGTGMWDLMASGAWNGTNGHGDRPAGMNMWQKIALGWVTPSVLDSTQTVSLNPAGDSAEACRINTTVPGEYFIVENRQQTGPFDVALPGSGMIIYHATEDIIRQRVEPNTVNAKYPQGMYMICADANRDPHETASSYGDINSPYAVFPGSAHITTFSDETLPSSCSTSGRYSYFELNDICQLEDGATTFNYHQLVAPARPLHLVAEAQKGVVSLHWDAPESDEQPVEYSVYENGKLVTTTASTSFLQSEPPRGSVIKYAVDATYPSGLVSPYVETAIRVPDNKVQSVETAVIQEEGDTAVQLRFALPTRLSHANVDDMNAYASITYDGVEAFEYGHRFTATDFYTLKGAKIKRVSFFPLQVPADVSYVVRVWETDAHGENTKVMTEKSVTEFGTAMWKEVTLPKAVTVIAGRDYYITVEVLSPTTHHVEVLTDLDGILQGRGNWIHREDGTWGAEQSETLRGNFFLYATISLPSPSKATTLPDAPAVEDASVDMLMPIGFRVYRDGEQIGDTGNSLFVDNHVAEGIHVYSVASLYRGNSESEGFTIDAITIGDGSDIDNLQIKQKGTNVHYYNLQGQKVLHPTAGTYIRIDGGKRHKVVVR